MSLVGDVMVKVLASIELDPPVGRTVISPGISSVWDNCCEGQLSLIINGIAPKGDPSCIVGWDVSITVEIIRCVAVIDDQGTPPSQEQITADALALLDDSEALRDQLLQVPHEVPQVSRIALTGWQPQNPEGGCAGGSWSARLALLC